MVGSDNDECLVGMLLIEFVCHLHGVVHIYHFGYERQVVGMACPVNLSTLNHHEETVLFSLLFHQEIDSRPGNVCQCQVIVLAVECIRYAIMVYLVGLISLQENHPSCALGLVLIVGVSSRYGKSIICSLLI